MRYRAQQKNNRNKDIVPSYNNLGIVQYGCINLECVSTWNYAWQCGTVMTLWHVSYMRSRCSFSSSLQWQRHFDFEALNTFQPVYQLPTPQIVCFYHVYNVFCLNQRSQWAFFYVISFFNSLLQRIVVVATYMTACYVTYSIVVNE